MNKIIFKLYKVVPSIIRIILQRSFYLHLLNELSISDQELIIAMPFHMGDTFIILSFLHEFKKYNNKNPIPLIHSAYVPLLNYYPEFKNKFFIFPKKYSFLKTEKIIRQMPLYLKVCNKFLYIPVLTEVKDRILICNLDISKILNMFEVNSNCLNNLTYCKYILNIDLNTKPRPPVISEDMYYRAKKLFEQYNLEIGKTVVLSPFSNSDKLSYNRENIEIFSKIAKNLKLKGYYVVTNINPKFNITIPNTLSILPPIDLIIPFLNLAGNTIVYRSGFADLAVWSNSKLFVLYPLIRDRLINKTQYEFFSLRFYLEERKNLYEIESNPNDYIKILEYF